MTAAPRTLFRAPVAFLNAPPYHATGLFRYGPNGHWFHRAHGSSVALSHLVAVGSTVRSHKGYSS